MDSTLTAPQAIEDLRVAELVDAARAYGMTAADALAVAAEWDFDGETGIGDTYRAVADELACDRHAGCVCGTCSSLGEWLDQLTA